MEDKIELRNIKQSFFSGEYDVTFRVNKFGLIALLKFNDDLTKN